jgi:hypothetical protein
MERKEIKIREAERVREDIEAEAEKQRMYKFKNSTKKYSSMGDLDTSN